MIGFYSAGAMGAGGGGGGSDLVANILARSGLLGYWRMNEPSGSTMNDSSGNGRHGTFVSGITLGRPSITPTDASTCARIASTGVASVADAAWMDPSNIGFLCVVKPDAVSTYQHIINKDTSGTTGHWIRINNNATVEATFRIAGSPTSATSAGTVSAGGVYIIEGGYDGSQLRLYVNGSLWAQVNKSGALNTNADNLQFGRNGGALFPFTGEIQHVAFFSVAPTAGPALATAQAGGFA